MAHKKVSNPEVPTETKSTVFTEHDLLVLQRITNFFTSLQTVFEHSQLTDNAGLEPWNFGEILKPQCDALLKFTAELDDRVEKGGAQ